MDSKNRRDDFFERLFPSVRTLEMSEDPEEPSDEPTRSFDEDHVIQREKRFIHFCDQLGSLPENYEPELADGIIADIDLHPLRWISLGLDLISSGKTCLLDVVLLYPVFQMGAEVFLKGMWLCQFDECRRLTNDYHVPPPIRQGFEGRLRDLGHDLLVIIAALRQVLRYRDDTQTLRFLKVTEGIVRYFYFPLYKADKTQ